MQKTSLFYYILGYVVALIIGIDCAISSWVYMNVFMTSNLLKPLICCSSIASLAINTILYANELPEALFYFKENTIIAYKFIFKEEKTISFYFISIAIAKEIISIASGILMGLFTLDSYNQINLMPIPNSITLLFSISFCIGTYAIVRTSLNFTYIDTETVWMKIINMSNKKKLLATILTAASCYATLLTVNTFTLAAAKTNHIALAAHLHQIFILICYYCTLFGEIVFTLKAVVWLCAKNNVDFAANKIEITLNAAILLNAIADASITAYDASKTSALFGFVYAAVIMKEYTDEFVMTALNKSYQANTEIVSGYKNAFLITVLLAASLAINKIFILALVPLYLIPHVIKHKKSIFNKLKQQKIVLTNNITK